MQSDWKYAFNLLRDAADHPHGIFISENKNYWASFTAINPDESEEEAKQREIKEERQRKEREIEEDRWHKEYHHLLFLADMGLLRIEDRDDDHKKYTFRITARGHLCLKWEWLSVAILFKALRFIATFKG